MPTGIIYKIYNENESIVYIGSTTQKLNKRWSNHKSKYKQWIEGNAGCCAIIYHNFKDQGIENFKIKLIKSIEYTDKCQLLKLENDYISTTDCINKNVSYTGISTENKLEYKKEYYESNKEKINEQKKQKFECDCGGKYTHTHKAKHLKTKKHKDYLETL